MNYRSEALGAFAHEFRTPLTAIKMVMELGRRSAEGEAIHLDPEVAAMLEESMDNLEELADGIQALSWLERGKLNLESGPCDLAAVFGQVGAILGETFPVSCSGIEGVSGPWDPARLPGVLAAVIKAASRCGIGDVAISAGPQPDGAIVTISSGQPGGDQRPINADLGFEFFAACVTLEYAGAKVTCERASRYLKIEIELPG